jgi:hypothetical protein
MHVPNLARDQEKGIWYFTDAPEEFDDQAALDAVPSMPITGAMAELKPRPPGTRWSENTLAAGMIQQASLGAPINADRWAKADQYWLLQGSAGPTVQDIIAVLRAGGTFAGALAYIEGKRLVNEQTQQWGGGVTTKESDPDLEITDATSSSSGNTVNDIIIAVRQEEQQKMLDLIAYIRSGMHPQNRVGLNTLKKVEDGVKGGMA